MSTEDCKGISRFFKKKADAERAQLQLRDKLRAGRRLQREETPNPEMTMNVDVELDLPHLTDIYLNYAQVQGTTLTDQLSRNIRGQISRSRVVFIND